MRTTSRRFALASLALALAFTCGRLTAGDDVAKEKKVRKLLELQGAYETAKIQYEGMLAQFDMNPGLPKGYAKMWRKMSSSKDLVELAVGPWAKHVDDATLDGLIAFFETAEGKKLREAQPRITQDASKAGAKWGMEMGMKVVLALQKEKAGEGKGDGGDDEEDEGEKKPPTKMPGEKKPEGDKKPEDKKPEGEKKDKPL